MTQDFTEQNRTLTLGRSVNLDFTTTEVNKVAYDKGFYIARWNPNVSAGIYLYQLTVGEKTVSKKMLLLK